MWAPTDASAVHRLAAGFVADGKSTATLSQSDFRDRVSQAEALMKEARDMAARRSRDENLGERFALRPRRRSRHEEAVEVLAEGLWTLICRGRGPAAAPSDEHDGAGRTRSQTPETTAPNAAATR